MRGENIKSHTNTDWRAQNTTSYTYNMHYNIKRSYVVLVDSLVKFSNTYCV